ncbi:hypothetical protein F1880_007236 [Penicillium rolfsii]|nr:hypothetical protein F1880_007236 [Penicillium rolfsii]
MKLTSQLLLLLDDNLVTHGVELVLIIITLLVKAGTAALALNPVVTGGSHETVVNGPNFLSEVLSELTGVSNDDNTTLEGLDGLGEGTEGVTVQVVGRLVKDNDVGALPRAGGEDDLDTLTTGQTAHAGVGNQLGIETEVGAVLLNLLTDERAELTGGEGLLLVNLGDLLGVRHNDLGTGQPGVVVGHHGSPLLGLHADVLTKSPRDLVLVGVLELAARVDADNTTEGTVDLVDLVHGLLVLLGDDLVGTVHGLTVLTGLETPLDVLRGSGVEVVIDVSESVLLDVGDTDVLVLVDITGGGDELTSQDVDESGLASTVGTNDGNTGAQGDLEGNVANLGLGSVGVLEGHVVDTDDGLGLGLDTLEETGLGELELHLGGTELVVGAGRGHTLDELGESTTVTLQLEALVVDDVLDDTVQETGVVGDHDGSAGGGLEVVLEPLNVLDVQVVGGLVEQENIGLLEDGTAQSELHLPTTREGTNGAIELGLEETELVDKLVTDLRLDGLETDLLQLLDGPANDSQLGIGSVQVVLNVDGLDLILLGETLKLLVVDSAHEGGLAGTVGAEETVTLTTLEAQVGLVQQNLGTVGQGEGAVAQILTLLLVGGDLIGSGGIGGGTLAEGLGNGLGGLLTDDGDDVREGVLGPGGAVGVLLVNELTSDGTNVVDDSLGAGNAVLELLLLEDILEDTGNGLDVTSGGDLGDLAVLDITDTGEGVKSLLGLLTGLGVGEGVVVLVQSRQHLGQEGSDQLGVLHELTHVVNDDSGLTLDGSLTLNETTVQQGDHDSEGGAGHVGNESGGTEQVNGLGDVLGLGNTLDELGNETLDILVDDQTANLLHGGVGGLLDVGLGVPHGLGDDGDEAGDLEGELSGGSLNKSIQALESGHLLGPLLGILERVENGGDNGLDGVAVDSLNDGSGGRLSGLLDGDHLVTNSVQNGAKERHKVGLNTGSDGGVGSDGADALAGTLAGNSILLVGELLLEGLDGLQGKSLLSDGTAEESGQVVGGSVDLIGRGGDVEVLDEVLEDGDRLGDLLARDGRNGRNVDGRHCG